MVPLRAQESQQWWPAIRGLQSASASSSSACTLSCRRPNGFSAGERSGCSCSAVLVEGMFLYVVLASMPLWLVFNLGGSR